jgi:hypothetical protein
MKKFLQQHDATISAGVFGDRRYPAGTTIYAPSDDAFQFMVEAVGLPVEEIVKLPIFEEIIANHIGGVGFEIEEGTIDGVAFGPSSEVSYVVSRNRVTNKVIVINGVLATKEQHEALQSSSEEVVTTFVEQKETVINPRTGKSITVGGKVYNQLVKDGVIKGDEVKMLRNPAQPAIPLDKVKMTDEHSERIKKLQSTAAKTIQAKGWKDLAPKKGKERALLKEKCGDACFLRPEDNSYPICAKLSETEGECRISCSALAAAKNRARFLPEEYRKKIIPELQKHFGCSP